MTTTRRRYRVTWTDGLCEYVKTVDLDPAITIQQVPTKFRTTEGLEQTIKVTRVEDLGLVTDSQWPT